MIRKRFQMIILELQQKADSGFTLINLKSLIKYEFGIRPDDMQRIKAVSIVVDTPLHPS